MRGNRSFATLLAALGLICAMSANASLHISPSTDPGNVHVGDTLDFTVSIDSIAPPPGFTWVGIQLSFFRISGPTSDANFDGICADLSGLSDTNFSCNFPLSNAAAWAWNPPPGGTSAVSGNLFSFEGLFNEVGTYSVFLESAFYNIVPTGGSGPIPFDFTSTNPVLIHVTEASVPEPATLALLSLGLAGLGFSRRKQ